MEGILLIDTLKREEMKLLGRQSLGQGTRVEGGSAAVAAAGGLARSFPSLTDGWASSKAGELPSTEGLLQRHCLT